MASEGPLASCAGDQLSVPNSCDLVLCRRSWLARSLSHPAADSLLPCQLLLPQL